MATLPGNVQADAMTALNALLRALAVKHGLDAFRLGARTAERELGRGELFDPLAQAFVLRMHYTGIQNVTVKLEQDVQDAVLIGIKEGLSVERLADELDGILSVARSDLERIARTEANRAANMGRFAGWKKSGIVREKEWMATADNRTQTEHLLAHGQRVPIDEAFIVDGEQVLVPPARPNCRCTVIPVTSLTDEESPSTEAQDEAIDEELGERGVALARAVVSRAMPGLIAIEDLQAAQVGRALADYRRTLLLGVGRHGRPSVPPR